MSPPVVVSLFDRSGAWPRPYAEAGATVVTVDISEALPETLYRGRTHWVADLLKMGAPDIPVDVMLLAPPCTEFAVSGARWWAAKDADGRTEAAVRLVKAALVLVAVMGPRVWALENPTGRLERLVPDVGPVRHSFDPCDYGDPYTKRTHLWGWFSSNLQRTPVAPERVCSQGSWVQKLGGKSERTKVLRSTTPAGFARAFAAANPVAGER
jgi:hypothetical protein